MVINTSAELKNLDNVIDEVRVFLTVTGASEDVTGRMEIVVEELFANVCSYSYKDGKGDVTVECSYDEKEKDICLRMIDEGIPFNPFTDDSLDVNEKAEGNSVGGLGIYMVRHIVDKTEYVRTGNKNIVQVKKKLAKNKNTGIELL